MQSLYGVKRSWCVILPACYFYRLRSWHLLKTAIGPWCLATGNAQPDQELGLYLKNRKLRRAYHRFNSRQIHVSFPSIHPQQPAIYHLPFLRPPQESTQYHRGDSYPTNSQQISHPQTFPIRILNSLPFPF